MTTTTRRPGRLPARDGANGVTGAGRRRNAARRGRAGPAVLLAGLLAVLLGLPSPAPGQERIDEQHRLEPDGLLEVRVVSHSVLVEPWDRQEVRITGSLDPETQRLEVSGDEGSLSVRIHHDRNGGSSRSHRLELRVPAEVRLTVSSVSGDLEVGDVSGPVRASSTSGSLRLGGAAESARLQTVSGEIEVTGAVPDLRFNSVSGSVRLDGIRGRVDGNTVSGSVRLGASAALERVRMNSVSGEVDLAGDFGPEARMEVQSHSGSVRLRLPADTPAAYEVRTMSGTIRNRITDDGARSEGREPGRTLLFRVGDATARVSIETFSGSVTLEPRR